MRLLSSSFSSFLRRGQCGTTIARDSRNCTKTPSPLLNRTNDHTQLAELHCIERSNRGVCAAIKPSIRFCAYLLTSLKLQIVGVFAKYWYAFLFYSSSLLLMSESRSAIGTCLNFPDFLFLGLQGEPRDFRQDSENSCETPVPRPDLDGSHGSPRLTLYCCEV